MKKEGIKFYSPLQEPFSLHGVSMDDGKYRRMPEQVAKAASDGVHALHDHTAGGRVRFCTDSPYIAISAKYDGFSRMPHMTITGATGFDLYTTMEDGQRYVRTFIPPFGSEDGFEYLIVFEMEQKLREFTINFPLYGRVKELYIGLDEEAQVLAPTPYRNKKPVVYYGSSITQGGCASRPGNSYQGVVSRRFHLDHINLGFSGSAKAEDAMIDYIKNLEMSMFVYDYDHNAPTAEHLAKTHEKMFQAVRAAHPDIPIIIMSRPKYYLTPQEEARLDIIKATYENARAAGDVVETIFSSDVFSDN